jgi:hypothetical protein
METGLMSDGGSWMASEGCFLLDLKPIAETRVLNFNVDDLREGSREEGFSENVVLRSLSGLAPFNNTFWGGRDHHFWCLEERPEDIGETKSRKEGITQREIYRGLGRDMNRVG